MARLVRVCPKGVAQHVIQRGNNRQVCFGGDQDMKAYLSWLKEYADKYKVDIHAWVLMTNHVHLLCTPNEEAGVSKMMQLRISWTPIPRVVKSKPCIAGL